MDADETQLMERPVSQGQSFAPGLYLVATPIGNLRDITLRALDVLHAADLVLCEDSRVSGRLMQAFGLKKKLRVYNDHSTEHDRSAILQTLQTGQIVALISDAGTPLISDPGYKLVRACIDTGLAVFPIPGPCAAIAGLQAGALPTDRFAFIGFLPARSGQRRKVLSAFAGVEATLVAYETGPRLAKSLRDCADVLGDRPACIAREITKRFEEFSRAPLSALADRIDQEGTPKGEIVLMIGPPESGRMDYSPDEVKELLVREMATQSRKQAVGEVSRMTGWAKRAVYDLALTLKHEGGS